MREMGEIALPPSASVKGGPAASGGGWPPTPWSLIRRARDGPESGTRRLALERLVEQYYVPIRRFLSRALGVGDDRAGDVAHDLFAALLERDFLQAIRHETSFRGFLKVVCRRHCATWRATDAASRRALHAAALGRALPDDAALDDAVDEELRRFYVDEAVRRLRERLLRCRKREALAIFEARVRFDGSRPEEYRVLAGRFGKRMYDIRNQLSATRKLFRRLLLTIAGERADDPRAELRDLGLHRYLAQ